MSVTQRKEYLKNRAHFKGFPGGAGVKNLPANAGDAGPSPGPGRSPGEGNGNPLQYSCLENSMDRGAWWVMVHRETEVDVEPLRAHFRLLYLVILTLVKNS